jgi:hypothetical protein
MTKPQENTVLQDWKLGKRIAEALNLRKSPSGSYKTEWGPKNEIGLARALRLILKP